MFCAFFKIGSILVAFITSPLTLSLPLMNSFCALAFPETSFEKSSSESWSVTRRMSARAASQRFPTIIVSNHRGLGLCNVPLAFFPSGAAPFPTVPVSFKSMCQLSVLPSPFFSVKPKMAPPFLMASLRSLSSLRASAIRSKADDDG